MTKQYQFLSDDTGLKYLLLRGGTVISLKTERPLSVVNNYHGYPRVTLWMNGKREVHFMHRLIATHFVDNPDNLPVVLHKDDNRMNYSADNLQWGTQQQNVIDSVIKKRHSSAVSSFKAKLTGEQVDNIKLLLSLNHSVASLSKFYAVSWATIHKIKTGKTWKDKSPI